MWYFLTMAYMENKCMISNIAILHSTMKVIFCTDVEIKILLSLYMTDHHKVFEYKA